MKLIVNKMLLCVRPVKKSTEDSDGVIGFSTPFFEVLKKNVDENASTYAANGISKIIMSERNHCVLFYGISLAYDRRQSHSFVLDILDSD